MSTKEFLKNLKESEITSCIKNQSLNLERINSVDCRLHSHFSVNPQPKLCLKLRPRLKVSDR